MTDINTIENGAWCGISAKIAFISPHTNTNNRYRMVDDVIEKKCTCCHEYWPADTEFFYASNTAKDSLSSHCKACFMENNGRLPGQRKKITEQVSV